MLSNLHQIRLDKLPDVLPNADQMLATRQCCHKQCHCLRKNEWLINTINEKRQEKKFV